MPDIAASPGDGETRASSEKRTEVLCLNLTHDRRRLYRRGNGSLTPDLAVAMAEPPVRRSPGEHAGAVVDAIFRLPPVRQGKQTPARIAWVDRLGAARVLPNALVEGFRSFGHVGDAEWTEIRKLIDLAPLEAIDVTFWELALEDGQGERISLPVDAEPIDDDVPPPPDRLVLAVIDVLLNDGWKLDWMRPTGSSGNRDPYDEDRPLDGVDRQYFFRRAVTVTR